MNVMKLKIIYLFILLTILIFSGCGENDSITSSDDGDSNPDSTHADITEICTDPFGSDSTLDIITWNVEHYPKHASTIDSLKKLIEILDVDIIAFQEVESNPIDLLPNNNWEVLFQSNSNLGYLINTEENITILESFSLFSGHSREFPRLPFVVKISYGNQNIYIVNNHLKAFGDNIINHDYSWDEEKRRLDACNMLEEHFSSSYGSDNIVILGDFNDQVNDESDANVFTAFIDNQMYQIADLEYAELNLIDNKSYPSYNSHIDHIIISDELIMNNIHTETIQAELYFTDRWLLYDSIISDHRPVGIKLRF